MKASDLYGKAVILLSLIGLQRPGYEFLFQPDMPTTQPNKEDVPDTLHLTLKLTSFTSLTAKQCYSYHSSLHNPVVISNEKTKVLQKVNITELFGPYEKHSLETQ